MKIRLFLMLFTLLHAAPIFAESIVQNGSLMEGFPILEPVKKSLQLYQNYSESSKMLHVNVEPKQKIYIDSSKIVTKKYVVLTATKPVTLDCAMIQGKNKFKDVTVTIKTNETVDYLTPLSEGVISVRYKSKFCSTSVGSEDSMFKGWEQKPVVEWWVRVINTKKKPLGWLLMDNTQVGILDLDTKVKGN